MSDAGFAGDAFVKAWEMRTLFSILLLGATLAAGQAGAPVGGAPYMLTSGTSTYAWTGSAPREDFDLKLVAIWTSPGSLLDTVGLAQARPGSYCLNVLPSGVVQFRLYNGREWQTLDTAAPLKSGVEYRLRLVRRSGAAHFEVNGVPGQSRRLDIPLAAATLYVGDFPGDAAFAPKLQVDLSAIGKLTLVSFSVPTALPKERLVDPAGLAKMEQAERLRGLIRKAEQAGYPLAVAFVQEAGEAGRLEADWIFGDLVSSGVLVHQGGLLLVTGAGNVIYQRHHQLGDRLPFQRIRELLIAAPQGPGPERIAFVLEDIAGRSGAPAAVAASTASTASTAVELGPEGGSVGTDQTVRVDFPAGALPQRTRVTIQRLQEPGGVAAYRIEAPGRRVLRKPARVTFAVPPGTVVVRRLSPKMALLPPQVRDPQGRVLLSTSCFSDWLAVPASTVAGLGRETTEIAGTTLAGTGACVVLWWAGGTVTAGTLAPVAIALVAGWYIGDFVYSRSVRASLDGPVAVEGFRIWWDPKTVPSARAFLLWTDRKGRVLQVITVAETREVADRIAAEEAQEPPDSSVLLSVNGREEAFSRSDLVLRRIPEAVLITAGELERARGVYTGMGFRAPANLQVAIHPNVGASNDQAKEANAGLWDGTYLSVNSTILQSDENGDNVRGTLAHEYWHALTTENGFSEAWPGKEESIATALESVVLGDPDPGKAAGMDFLKLRQWTYVEPVLRNGLRGTGPDESASSRGYNLWPWPKFILHRYGVDAFRSYVEGRTQPGIEQAWFDDFGHSLILGTADIPDPATLKIGGRTVSTITGWRAGVNERPGTISYWRVAQTAAAGSLKWGANSRGSLPPFSVQSYNVDIPVRDPACPPSPYVIRRASRSQPERFRNQLIVAAKATPRGVPLEIRRDALKEDRISLLTPPEWDEPTKAQQLPLTLISTGEGPSLADEPLLLYRLAPPRDITVFASPGNGGEALRVNITPEPSGGNARGYRLWVRLKSGAEKPVADLVYPSPAPVRPPSPGIPQVRLDPQIHYGIVQPTGVRAAEVAAFGMATLDAGPAPGEKELLSAIRWQTQAAPQKKPCLFPSSCPAEAGIVKEGDPKRPRQKAEACFCGPACRCLGK